ncbi:MAG: winged helix-turn-helix domain-containing protein [Candidatus Dormibacteraeota bacterium]|nr:winged helix-turn-helix domain-containing protein [Candidatus Dormibacteraeota bacterium]
MQERNTEQLLQGENPETQHAADARRWIAIYSQLVTFNEELLARLHREVGGDAGQRGLDVDDRIAEWELTRLRDRLTFWQHRHRELAGVDIDESTGMLYGSDGAIPLTARESQLLIFLLQRPDRYFTPSALAAQAWHDPRLAAEQVRSYVVRLRRRLAEARVACRIISRRGLGYMLSFETSRAREA